MRQLKEKRCRVCNKPFMPTSSCQFYCKSCGRERHNEYHRRYMGTEKGKRYAKRYRKSNKGKFNVRKGYLKYAYDLTIEEYDRMFEDQNNGCAICSGLCLDGRRLHVDHDHQTGKIRGLLCQKCNHGLGMFNDDVELFQRVIEYLKDSNLTPRKRQT